MARIINLRDTRGVVPTGAARVDRRTVYGNPFIIGRDGTRDGVCDKFERWWYACAQRALRKRALRELHGKDLACWCAPRRCHAAVILDDVNS